MRYGPTPNVPLTAERLESLSRQADVLIAKEIAAGTSTYDTVWPVVRKIRQQLGRPGIGLAVGLLIDEGVFKETDRHKVEQSMRVRWRKETQEGSTPRDRPRRQQEPPGTFTMRGAAPTSSTLS